VELKRVPGLVSVVIPCWNRKQYIRDCLDRLAKQTYGNMEIIVVNDGSTDGSADVVRHWRDASGRLKRRIVLINLPRNIGYAGAVTVGMFATRGEFIALQDSDDYAHPERMRKQVNHLRKHPRIGIVGTNYRVVESGRVQWNKQPGWLAFGEKNVHARYRRGSHCLTVGSTMIRGRAFDRVGGMNRRVNGAEDWELIDHYIQKGVRVDNLMDVLHFVRRHAGQRSRKFYR